MLQKLDTVGKRLEYAIEKAGYDRGDFATAIDIHYETLGRYIRDSILPKNRLKRDAIEELTGLRIEWIETGEGDMRPEPDYSGYQEISLPAMGPGEYVERVVPMYKEGAEMVDENITHGFRIVYEYLTREETLKAKSGIKSR